MNSQIVITIECDPPLPAGTTLKVKHWMQNAESLPVEKYLTSKQAAAYIGVHIDTFREWVRLGKFPRIPLPGKGKDFRFSRESIDAWAEARELGRNFPKEHAKRFPREA